MKANELRIGNLVYLTCLSEIGEITQKIFSIRASTIRDAEHYGHEWTGKPIPLTEEWLIKFGFDKHNTIKNSLCHFQVLPTGQVLIYDDREDFIPVTKTQYVHQLQNLYFALTGEELTIKEVIQ